MSSRLLTLAWLGVILLLATVPWSNFRPHSHWDSVNWIPLAGPSDNIRDMVLNTLLFVPFGYLCARGAGTSTGVLVVQVGTVALLLSATLETLQVFAHNRVATVTDVFMNVTGAVLGVVLQRWRRAAGNRQ